jgi:hypothetical protein
MQSDPGGRNYRMRMETIAARYAQGGRLGSPVISGDFRLAGPDALRDDLLQAIAESCVLIGGRPITAR